jgi:tellurite resistance protein TerC
MFEYLHYGLAGVLGFIGVKMLGDYVGETFYGREEAIISPFVSLAIIAVILGASIAASLLFAPKEEAADDAEKK